MSSRSINLGGLSCQVVEEIPDGNAPQLVVILCHGYGAPGTDLVPIGHELLTSHPNLTDKVRFVFPAAPLSLDEFGLYGARAWWPLDMNRLTAAIERGEFRDLRNDLPDELPEVREKFSALVREIRIETGLPNSRFVLGGFSQGSMLATDAALRLDETPAALCIWSGTLLCEDTWKELAAKRPDLHVLQSHGRQDPLLPFEAALWLRNMLIESGMDVDFIEFDGMHTIPLEALQRFGALLSRLTAD